MGGRSCVGLAHKRNVNHQTGEPQFSVPHTARGQASTAEHVEDHSLGGVAQRVDPTRPRARWTLVGGASGWFLSTSCICVAGKMTSHHGGVMCKNSIQGATSFTPVLARF